MNVGIFGTPSIATTETWFYPIGIPGTGSASKGWQRWERPKDARFITIFMIGAGAGGGGGFSGTAGTARGGGSGGGSSAMSQALFLASSLPDQLFIQVAKGGLGGAAGTTAPVVGHSYVNLAPTIGAAYGILHSSNAVPGPGVTGTGAGAATGGAGGGAITIANTCYASLAISWKPVAGLAGLAGGSASGADGTGVNSSLNGFLTGGTGGAGVTTTNFVGGSIITQGIINTTPGGTAGGGAGSAGVFIQKPFSTIGGTGGGSNNSGVGGRGGDGAYGSGGGGGGAGVTGGAGGNGGDGLVIISTW